MTSDQFTPDKNSVYLRSILLLIVLTLYACSKPPQTPIKPTISPARPQATPTASGVVESTTLNQEQAATLSSLKKIDDYPLYTMHYFGSYDQTRFSGQGVGSNVRSGSLSRRRNNAWGCSLFASFGDYSRFVRLSYRSKMIFFDRYFCHSWRILIHLTFVLHSYSL